MRQMIIRKHGVSKWEQILQRAGFKPTDTVAVNRCYPDDETMALVEAMCIEGIGKSIDDVWRANGEFHIDYVLEIGWEDVLHRISKNLIGFLESLHAMHFLVSREIYKCEWNSPSFHCEEKDESIHLTYYTFRLGIYPFVEGLVKRLALKVFNREITIEIKSVKDRKVKVDMIDRTQQVITYIITGYFGQQSNCITKNTNAGITVNDAMERKQLTIKNPHLSQYDFIVIFPYHVIFDQECKLVQAGKEIYNNVCHDLLTPGTPITRIFQLQCPSISFDFRSICEVKNALFVVELFASKLPRGREMGSMQEYKVRKSPAAGKNLMLKGQMIHLENRNLMLFMATPEISIVPDLLKHEMRLTSLPLHDVNRDLILLNQQHLSDAEINKQLRDSNAELESLTIDLEAEKMKTEELLKEMLPLSIAEKLLSGKSIDASEFRDATVMFSDIPSFHHIISNCEPRDIILLLNDVFTKFDRLVIRHKVYKVETVGDSYMTVCGVPEIRLDHCESICNLALGMLCESRSIVDPISNLFLRIRLGIHSGTVVAGVIGNKMPRFCLFGDTVNTASRMGSHSLPGRIHCSKKAVDTAQATGDFKFVFRGLIPVKGLLEERYSYEEMSKGIENDILPPLKVKSRACSIQ